MMHKILLFAGTTEGRLAAAHLAGRQIQLDVSVATDYGRSLLPSADNIRILDQRLNAEEIRSLLHREGYTLVLDATHPYAQEVSENILAACRAEKVRCIRILREESALPDIIPGDCSDFTCHILFIDTAAQAAEILRGTTGPVFLTTGSKTLPLFMQIPDAPQRIFARILPAPEMLQQALDLGLPGSHIFCVQGPFSVESNLASLRAIRSRWNLEQPAHADAPLTLVTKESGLPGGFAEKMRAAAYADADLIVIRRPQESASAQDCMMLSQALDLLDELCGDTAPEKPSAKPSVSDTTASDPPREVFLIGCGMSARQLTLEADTALRSCDLLIGASRLLEMTAHYGKKTLCSYDYERITDYLLTHPEIRSAAALFSGDIGLYSGAARLRSCLAPYADAFRITPLSGISSPVYFLNLLGKSYEDTRVLSLHGQTAPISAMLRTQGKLLVLLGRQSDVPDLCRSLLAQDMGDVQLTVGSDLGSPQERIVSGSPSELADTVFPRLSVVFLEYPRTLQESAVHGLPDEAFIRGSVPMTKSEVRSVLLSKLQLTRKAVFFDIGAGTGSVAVEAARMIPEGKVFAIERNEEALSLIHQNAVKLHADHLEIVAGTAPEALSGLPAPTHAFIGGSGGRIREILKALLQMNPQVRIVASAVTTETLLALQSARETLSLPEPEIVQLQVSRSRKAGSSHLMQALNPVFLISFVPSPIQNKED